MPRRKEDNPKYKEVRTLVAQRVREQLSSLNITQTDLAIDHYQTIGLGTRSSSINYMSNFMQARGIDGRFGEKPFTELELSRLAKILTLLNLNRDRALIERIRETLPDFRGYLDSAEKL